MYSPDISDSVLLLSQSNFVLAFFSFSRTKCITKLTTSTIEYRLCNFYSFTGFASLIVSPGQPIMLD